MRRIKSALILSVFAVALTACGGFGRLTPASGTAPQAVSALGAGSLRPESIPKVAGTYQGSYSETIGNRTVKGTVTITVKQSGANISGEFDVVVKGKYHFLFPIKGKVSSGKHGAKLHFTLINIGGNRNANAKAHVIGSKLKGKALAPGTKSEQPVHIKFSAKKT